MQTSDQGKSDFENFQTIGPKSCTSMCHGKGRIFGGWADCVHGLSGRLAEIDKEAALLRARLALPVQEAPERCSHAVTHDIRRIHDPNRGWHYESTRSLCEETVEDNGMD